MARQLLLGVCRPVCHGLPPASQVVLEFQSNWLACGARLDVQELRAGYAEVPQDAMAVRVSPRHAWQL